ncbi:Phage-related baseplate assembly protein [Caballeronia calidae]|uniref:Phage-related baseplate assembly protein n=1 Tax=Caballeronia calidae TaxID=1777139 RepID=A0A158ED79_9BURK|nr:phage baseplate assembly protein V [Caballeronia calidae]SAL04852.1 Phage-related baseplate assembly protein [Caballeronia calidae]
MSNATFYGIYRGTVLSNLDPLTLARLQVNVPEVPGASDQSWAKPCVAFAASDKGPFALPPVGANVWVMFEKGNPADPVWMGGFWDQSSRPPATPAVETMKVFKTDGLTVTLTDQPGAAMLEIELSSGPKLSLGPAGITIDGGKGAKIELQGIKVSVNSGALEVM